MEKKKAEKKKITLDLNKITSKRRNFLKNINFSKPSIMGILNLTPDSFSDGGVFNNYKKALANGMRLSMDLIKDPSFDPSSIFSASY